MASRALTVSTILAGVVSLNLASTLHADTVIGSWENDSPDGWIDWGTQAALAAPKYTYDSFGATNGTRALKVTQNGYGQSLSIKLQDNNLKSAFFANTKFSIDFSDIGSGLAGFNEIYSLAINAGGYGFVDQPQHPKFQYGYPAPNNRTTTVTWDYSALLDGDTGNGEILPSTNYIEFILAINGDADHQEFWFDNARLVSDAKPGDFNKDTVVNALDIDLLFHATAGAVPPADPLYDVNKDSNVITGVNVANSDADYLVHTILGTQYGDSDLDKNVDFDDLVKLAQNYGTATGATWSDGSFNGDGKVDFDDLVLVAQNYGFLAPASLTTLGAINSDFAGDWVLAQSLLPEPSCLFALAIAVPSACRRRK